MTIYRYRLSYKIPEFWGERYQQVTIDSRRRLTQENRLTLEQWIAHLTVLLIRLEAPLIHGGEEERIAA